MKKWTISSEKMKNSVIYIYVIMLIVLRNGFSNKATTLVLCHTSILLTENFIRIQNEFQVAHEGHTFNELVI